MNPSLTDELSEWIKSGKPMLLARLGGTEGKIAGQYCEKILKLIKNYNSKTLDWLFSTSGFFADDYETKTKAVDEYARLTLDGLKDCDYLSAMFPPKIYMPYFLSTTPKMQPQLFLILDLILIFLQKNLGRLLFRTQENMNPPEGKHRYAARKTPIRARNAVIRQRNALRVKYSRGESSNSHEGGHNDGEKD